MPKKYRICNVEPRKKMNKSIFESNINKQQVKVNVNTGLIPQVYHIYTSTCISKFKRLNQQWQIY